MLTFQYLVKLEWISRTSLSPSWAQAPRFKRKLINIERNADLPVPGKARVDIPHLTLSFLGTGTVFPERINKYREKC
jgi:hypothetical protein